MTPHRATNAYLARTHLAGKTAGCYDIGGNGTTEMPQAAQAMMSLPASALTRSNDKAAIFIVTPKNQLQLRPITLGGYTTTSIFVTQGIEPGENVVTAGVSKLRAG